MVTGVYALLPILLKSETARPVCNSSMILAVMLTVFVDLGTTGKCVTSTISGAIFEAATELARPGVPLLTRLARQFWPYWFGIDRLTSSSDLPPPPCSEYHCQPW